MMNKINKVGQQAYCHLFNKSYLQKAMMTVVRTCVETQNYIKDEKRKRVQMIILPKENYKIKILYDEHKL